MSSFVPPKKKDWADDDSDDDDPEELRRALGTPSKPKSGQNGTNEPTSPQKDQSSDPPVASLLSRIGGLSTGEDSTSASATSDTKSSQPSTSPSSATSGQRPKPNISNPLFGRALAGVKSDRAPKPTPAEPAASPAASAGESAPSPVTASSEKKEEESKAQPVETKTDEPKKEEGKMATNIMDRDDGWGTQSNTGGWGEQASNTAPSNNGFGGKTNGASHADDGGWGGGPEKVTAAPAAVAEVKKEDESMSMGGASGLISNDFQVEVKLADLQADINSPLYSAKSFEELPIHDDLKRGIYGAGFKKPSKIQERALPMLLNNPPRNLIGQSQSGTGKTAAFTLDMLSRVDPNIMTPQAICLAPSRELARQIQEVVNKIGQFTAVKSFLAVPQSWKRGQKIQDHILIGTPGTILDMLTRGGTIFDPKMIRVFVLDEADEMISQQNSGAGLGDQTIRIKRMLSKEAQIVLFSATFPDRVRDFASRIAPEANEIYLKQEDVTVEAIKQLWLQCNGEQEKFEALSLLYELMTIGQSIVFCRRKDTADQIAQRLTEEGHSVASLHGGKDTLNRDEVLDTFRNGKTKVLITTNVVARGIDISQVNMVVNYDVPLILEDGGWTIDLESYIHRIGRTGRFGRKGCSIIFAHDERSMRDIQEIQDRLGGKPMKKVDATRQSDIDQLEKALKAALKGPA